MEKGQPLSWFQGLRCQKCGKLYPVGETRCPKDGGLLLADYDFKKEAIPLGSRRQEPGIWRFLPMMPPLSKRISRDEGNTPISPSRKLGKQLGVTLFFKDEGANPSGSFKDRGVAVMTSALAPSVKTVIMMSSGNAASSVALYSALAGIRAVILVHRGGTSAKAFMTQAYGAMVFNVQAEREADILALTEQLAKEKGWTLMNTVAAGNPLILEGYKTLSYELIEELNEVDAVFVPTGSGTLISGIWKGFDELYRLGVISHIPRLIGVQPIGSCPIVKAFEAGLKYVPKLSDVPNTVVAPLTLDDPKESGALALQAVNTSEGSFIAVDDDSILSACRSLALNETLLVEPAAATSFAGLKEAIARGIVRKGERVVCVLTGHGLKDFEPVRQSMPSMEEISADEREFMRAYERIAKREKG